MKTFIILITFTIIKLFRTQICPQYNCTTQENKCYKEINPLLIDIQDCNDGKKCEKNSGDCKSRQYDTYKQFNGGPCNEKKDCLNGECDNSMNCINTDKKCTRNIDCAIGFFCDLTTSICHNLKKLNEACNSDEDCEYNLACDSLGDKICVNYFSLEEGALVNPSSNLLCNSGFAIDGKCVKGKLISEEDCSKTGHCIYQGNDQKIYNTTEKCNCGYNNFGGKLCDSSFDDQKNEVIKKEYQVLIDQNPENCHTTERLKQCVAFSFDRKNTNTSTSNRFEYDKAKRILENKLTLNSNLFKNNTENYCGYSVLGNYNNYIVPPESVNSCPVYKCESSTKNCLESFNPNNNNSSGIVISLNENICEKNQYCDYEISQTKILGNYNGQCKIKNPNVPRELQRYPGEDCSDDTDCTNGLCLNGICYSKKFGEICDPNTPNGIHGCGLGMFCGPKKNSSDFHQCENLKVFGEECENSFECEMDTICYDGVCSKEYFSFDNGKKINEGFIKDEHIKKNVQYLCQSFYYSDKEKKCVEYKIVNKTYENGYVECDISDKNSCLYEIIGDGIAETFTRECKCGFNTEGKAYCPIDNNHCKFFLIFNF